ncbi:hypothetical protein DAPPUDRAFT_252477 [Daphnia pulex]|uniref:Uncharacterized protein n=1 Tax=Daphnia pulex TaxID=6669 RepID=E9H2S2_DAPPU|nr:hypothetical protein DAPPUDRAFT_252477 [Daphnia pulex]|eukprot:EFX73961.1 hypothetical protein DAPPUDRAFT_252477 [Daphnia pulex]
MMQNFRLYPSSTPLHTTADKAAISFMFRHFDVSVVLLHRGCVASGIYLTYLNRPEEIAVELFRSERQIFV